MCRFIFHSCDLCFKVKKHFRLSCDHLQSVHSCNGTLWCCKFHVYKRANYKAGSWGKKPNHLSLSLGSRDSIMEVWRNGSLKHRLKLSEQQRGSTATFSSILLLPEVQQMQFALFLFLYWCIFFYLRPHVTSVLVWLFPWCFVFCFFCLCVSQREELWSVCIDSGDVFIWNIKDTKTLHRITLQDCTGCYCMIKVKNQVTIQKTHRFKVS